jgi:predicted permease
MLPVREPEKLLAVTLRNSAGKLNDSHSYPLYALWRDHQRAFEGLAATGTLIWRHKSPQGNGAVHDGQFVSGNYFEVLGVPALIGRTITPADDSIEGSGGPEGPVVVLSHRYWRRAWNGSSNVLGQRINVNGVWATVVGVTPPEFFGTRVGFAPDVFVPAQIQPATRPGENFLHNVAGSETTWLTVLGRFRKGVSPAQAAADLTPMYAEYELTRMNADDQKAYLAGKKPLPESVALEPASRGFSALRERFSEPLKVLMVVLVAIVLLIACSNVANLMLARASARQKEIAVRLAIGAGRFRIVRQLLAESAVLALAGGTLGLAFALWSSRLLVAMLPQGLIPIALEVAPDLRVLGFTLTASVLTVLLFGLAPALRATGFAISGSLNQGRSRGRRLPRLEAGKMVAVIEVALAVQLLVVAGLFVWTLRKIASIDAGFERQNVVQTRINLDVAGFKRPQWAQIYQQIQERISSLPGVSAASLTNHGLIGTDATRSGPVHFPGYQPKPGESRQLPETYVGTDYFKATGIPLRKGRLFAGGEGSPSAQVAIVNEEIARRYFAEQDPIGQRFGFGNAPGSIEIVGVVADAKYHDLRQAPTPMAYYPWRQVMPARLNDLIVRTQGDPRGLMFAIRRVLAGIHPDIFVDTRTLNSQIEDTLVREHLLAYLSGFFGGLAIVLACIGLHCVMAYGVTRRTPEIGVRMVLGAQPSGVLCMVLRETILLAAAGIVIGTPIALWLTRLAKSFLFGLEPHDPVVMVLAVVCLLAVSLLAGWLPARRAARIDPVAALRNE